MTNSILNWTEETVTWGDEVVDVSSEACAAQPMLTLLRHSARQFDDVAEEVVRYAEQVASEAKRIREQAANGLRPDALHHQRLSDLNHAVTRYNVLAEQINAMTNILTKSKVGA